MKPAFFSTPRTVSGFSGQPVALTSEHKAAAKRFVPRGFAACTDDAQECADLVAVGLLRVSQKFTDAKGQPVLKFCLTEDGFWFTKGRLSADWTPSPQRGQVLREVPASL